MSNKKEKFITILLIIPFLIWITVIIVNAIAFDRYCKDYLKLAADANTIEMAKTELNIALKYMEENNLTDGYTSVIYKSPGEDVYFWYNNIKSARNELNKINDSTTSPLEKTNVLMKLRETLLDDKNGDVSVTAPPGISLYPNNVAYTIFGIISIICLIISIWIFLEIFL